MIIGLVSIRLEGPRISFNFVLDGKTIRLVDARVEATMLFLGSLVRFIWEQSRNCNVLLVRGVVASFLTQLVQNFNNLYIIELCATPFQLSTTRL